MVIEDYAKPCESTISTAEAYPSASGGKHLQTFINTNNQMMHNVNNTDINILIRNCTIRNLANNRHNDSYVHSKLGDPAWIPAEDRCRLCEKTIECEGPAVSSWIGVSRGESEWVHEFVDFGPVTKNLRDFLNSTLVDRNDILKYPLRVVYVCGLDHFNKCPYVQNMATQNNISVAVVYRMGYDEQ
ncbi:unnamed protein product, partial [Rotaria sordida]